MIHKLITLVMSIFIIIAGGSSYYYPLYLSGIMQKYSYSVTQAQLFASFINFGYWLTFPLGIIYDMYGPGISLIIACICLPGSYTVLNLLITMIKGKIHIITMIILGFIMGQGSALCHISSLVTNMKNFPKSNLISGILLTNLAISPSLFTSYQTIVKNKTKNDYEFIVFIGLILALIIGLGSWLVQVQPTTEEEDEKKKRYMEYKEAKMLRIIVGLNLLTLSGLIIGIIINNKTSDSKFSVIYFFPLIQFPNIIIIFLEKCKFWDALFVKSFSKKEPKEKAKKEVELKTLEKVKDVNNIQPSNMNSTIKKEEILFDVNSEKSIVDKKLNLSFNYEKRIDELKVKYELSNSNENTNNFYNNFQMQDQNSTANNQEGLFFNPVLTEGTSTRVPVNGMDPLEKQNPKPEKREGYIETIPDSKEYEDEIKNPKSNTFQLLTSPKVIKVFFIIMFGFGSSSAFIRNIENILGSINPKIKPETISDYSIIFFAFDSFSSLISGPILDALSSKDLLGEYLLLISLAGLVSQLIGVSMNSGAMYATTVLSGLVNGLSISYIPIFVKKNNLPDDYGKVLGFLVAGIAFGVLLISDFLFRILYFKFKDSNDFCNEKKCFRYSFLITSTFFLFNVALCFFSLFSKYKKRKKEKDEKKKDKTKKPEV